MVKHERLYTVLLMVFSVGILCSMGILAAFLALPPDARPPTKWPDWVLVLSAFLNGMYFCAMVLTLIFRRAQPSTGRQLTRLLNIALLFAPPFLPVLGLYGLWKVDRPAQGNPA
jgi:hypothetical protein